MTAGIALDGADQPVWVTPDAVVLDVDVAGIGSRGIAYLLDLAVVLTALLMLQLAQMVLGGGGFVPGSTAIAVLLLAAFVLQFGYPIGFEVLWRGRSLGKVVMGLRVITVEGAPVGFRHATIRAAAAVFELLATLGLGAIITAFVSPRSQRLGDLAAGTIVIRERRADAAVMAMHHPVPSGLEGFTHSLEVDRLRGSDRALVRDVLRRVPALAPGVRRQVVTHVARTLMSRVTPLPPPGLDPETWLRCVAARLAAANGPPSVSR